MTNCLNFIFLPPELGQINNAQMQADKCIKKTLKLKKGRNLCIFKNGTNTNCMTQDFITIKKV